MAEIDPVDLLSGSLDRAEAPDADFASSLHDRLVAELEANPTIAEGEVTTVLDLKEDPVAVERDLTTRTRRRWARTAIAAAVVLVLIIAAVVLSGDSESGTLDVIDGPVPSGRLDLETAQLLLERAGGEEGLALATIPFDRPTSHITFDPLDNSRVLIGSINGGTASADLWIVDDGDATRGSVPWLESQDRFWQGGMFQRDGTIYVADGATNAPTSLTLLDNAGELVAVRDIGASPSYLPVSEGEYALTLTTSAIGCPYQTVVLAGPDGPVTLDDRLRAFVRTDIPQPGVGMAFPHLGHKESCAPPESPIAQAWDLQTAEPMPDYPLHGLEIARASVSGDGSAALVMDPEGAVSLLSMDTGETVATLGTYESRGVLNPIELNHDASIGVVTEDTGRTTMWHLDTGTLLLEVMGDVPDQRAGSLDIVTPGAGLAYDTTRLAVLDAESETWSILALDPSDWAEIGCDRGAGIAETALAGRGLREGAGC